MSFTQGRPPAPTNTNMKDSTIEINMEDLIEELKLLGWHEL